MVVAGITIHVKPEFIDAFIAATLDNHRNSIKEPGNRRFDFLRSRNDPNRFFLYEVFVDQAAVEAHKQTAHYARWRDTVKDMMAQTREGVPYEIIAPADPARW